MPPPRAVANALSLEENTFTGIPLLVEAAPTDCLVGRSYQRLNKRRDFCRKSKLWTEQKSLHMGGT
jgi:hypothetical protein